MDIQSLMTMGSYLFDELSASSSSSQSSASSSTSDTTGSSSSSATTVAIDSLKRRRKPGAKDSQRQLKALKNNSRRSPGKARRKSGLSSSTGLSPLVEKMKVVLGGEATKRCQRHIRFGDPATIKKRDRERELKKQEITVQHTALNTDLEGCLKYLSEADNPKELFDQTLKMIEDFIWTYRKDLGRYTETEEIPSHYMLRVCDLCERLKLCVPADEMAPFLRKTNQFIKLLISSRAIPRRQLQILLNRISSHSEDQVYRNYLQQHFFIPVQTSESSPARGYRWKSTEEILGRMLEDIDDELLTDPRSEVLLAVKKRILQYQVNYGLGKTIPLQRSFHTCPTPEALVSILKTGIRVTDKKKYKGAFVSNIPQFDFGNFVVTVNVNTIASMRREITRHERRCESYGDGGGLWTGLGETIPCDVDLVIYDDDQESAIEAVSGLSILLKDDELLGDCEFIPRSEFEIFAALLAKYTRHQAYSKAATHSPYKGIVEPRRRA